MGCPTTSPPPLGGMIQQRPEPHLHTHTHTPPRGAQFPQNEGFRGRPVLQALVGLLQLLVLQAALLQLGQRGFELGLHLHQLPPGHAVLLVEELQDGGDTAVSIQTAGSWGDITAAPQCGPKTDEGQLRPLPTTPGGGCGFAPWARGKAKQRDCGQGNYPRASSPTCRMSAPRADPAAGRLPPGGT